MNEKEVATLLNELYELYGSKMNTEDPKERFTTYCKHLSKADGELVQSNLQFHIEHSEDDWPPTIRDLIKKGPKETKSTIPSIEETQQYISRFKKNPLTPEQIAEVEKRREAMRKRLGVDEE